jgi:hypothetical protein
MRMAVWTPLGREVQKPEPNQVPTTPGPARPSATSSDPRGAPTWGNQTQADAIMRNRGAWRAELLGVQIAYNGASPAERRALRLRRENTVKTIASGA